MASDYPLTDNTVQQQYEFHINDSVAKIEYKKRGAEIFLVHTEVPKELEGKGIAAALVQKALTDIEKKKLTLVPLCPYVVSYIKRHPEWKRILREDVHL